ncbi:hypothetical protein ACFFQF_16565 [Haladaptatus pallidirubidus]|nr:hypothetical protein [Haladaptatus pallidirubidus]
MQIPPLSIEAPNETARETVRRHTAILIGLIKVLLVGGLIQIVVLGSVGAVALYILNVSQDTSGWMVIFSWFGAAYLMKFYARSVFPVNGDRFERV